MQAPVNDIEMIKDYVLLRGGDILDDQLIYVDRKTIMATIICGGPQQHHWITNIRQAAKRGFWCKECTKGGILTIGEMRQLAINRGGQCLSDEYIHSQQNLWWKCAIPDHKPWEATPNSIKCKESWCPQCGRFPMSLGEIITRAVLVEALPEGGSFDSTRSALGNRRLELDCYSASLNFAVEYQGKQHYDLSPIFQDTEEDLRAQKARDEDKRLRCAENGIWLLEVPYYIPHRELRPWIRTQLLRWFPGIDPKPPAVPSNEEFYCNIRLNNKAALLTHEDTKKIALYKGCEVIEKLGPNNCTDKLILRCGLGHEFRTCRKNLIRTVGDYHGFCTTCVQNRVAQSRAEREEKKLASRKNLLLEKDDAVCFEIIAKVNEKMREAYKNPLCGFEYVSSHRENRNYKDNKLYITMKCLICRCETVRDRDNFASLNEVRMCTGGCARPHYGGPVDHSMVGQAFVDWQEKHGLIFLGSELKCDKNFEWKCAKIHHVFLDKSKNIKGRISKGDSACIICPLIEKGRPLGLELIQQDVYSHGINSKRKYKCVHCNQEIEAGYITLHKAHACARRKS